MTVASGGTSSTMLAPWHLWSDSAAYFVDSWQRSVLYLDVMRQRGDERQEHLAQTAPHVLSFEGEVVLDGRKLDPPVNYGLVRIRPPDGFVLDRRKRPFVVVDPRAGHGPGIGGFKADSEIGVALRAGHPCYFIGFLPRPLPGQTVEDVMRAESAFMAKVAELHPEAEGRPVAIGNCQAGWQLMMTAATAPDRFGPIIVAGSPLSYWAGKRGVNPMRYTGGLLGGSWLTALSGDLGAGIFDGAWLVANFESMNPANTLWAKQYNLYSKIDTEPDRYLGFERWWGGHVLLNADEMQYIVDNLFVGNKLATSEMVTSDGVRIDLRNIRSPIIVFCSKGDDITPPPQALGWITDLYASVDDIRAHGQTIVYAVHESIGHLGIFVSAGVAKKEHGEFASNIDFIDVLPPGLYEAVITPRGAGDANADLIVGDYLLRFAARDLDDIRAIVGSEPEDERRFATVARLSEINLGLYRTLVQPWLRPMVSEAAAEWLRRLHPLRLQYELLSSSNPFLGGLDQLADRVRADRRPAASDNLFRRAESEMGEQIEAALKAWGELRDRWQEQLFIATYGSPILQALVGLKAREEPPRARPGDEPEHREWVARQAATLRRRIGEGGLREALVRSLLYIRLPERIADERAFNLLRRLRQEESEELALDAFKALVREQFFMLLLDTEAALATLPRLLDATPAARIGSELDRLRRVVDAAGSLGETGRERLAAVEKIFEAAAASGSAAAVAAAAPSVPTDDRDPQVTPLHRRAGG